MKETQLQTMGTLPPGVPTRPPPVSGRGLLDPETKEQLVAFIAFEYLGASGRINWRRAFGEHPEWASALGVSSRDQTSQDRLYAFTHRLLRKLTNEDKPRVTLNASDSHRNGQVEVVRNNGHSEVARPEQAIQKVILWPHFCWNCGAALVAPAGKVAHCCSQCGTSQTEVAEAMNRSYAQAS